MSVIDDILNTWQKVEEIKSIKPREVQTAEQSSVAVRQDVSQTTAAKTPVKKAGGILSTLTQNQKILLGVAGLLGAGLLIKRVI